MVLTYKTGASGDLAEYYRGSKQVPEMAAKLASYLGDAYALDVAAGTAALPAMDMHPLIADLLKIDTTRSVTQEEVVHLLSGLCADGSVIPGRGRRTSTKDRASLTFTDFTFSAPKSLSIAISLAPTEREQIRLETAFMRANNKLMNHIESEIGGARQGDGGSKGVTPGHMASLQFHHHVVRPTVRVAAGTDTKVGLASADDMRPGDMGRHVHNLFMHVTITDDGDVKAPDLNTTKGRIHEWGAIGHAFLATELRAAGVRVEIDPRTGLSHLPDVPQDTVDLFSARTRDGEVMARAKAAAKGDDFDNLSQQYQTRLKKGQVSAGRQVKEDMSEAEFWRQTAADGGYQHQSVIHPENRQDLAPEAERARVAYEAALPMLEPEWERRAKLDSSTIRTMAARGLIASGIKSAAEIDAVLSAFETEGVRQDGRMVTMIPGREHNEKFTSATTSLHIQQETEAIGILKAAAADKSGALTHEQIEAAAARMSAAKGYDFITGAGPGQLQMADALSTGGRSAVGVGSAGSGKTALLSVAIDAHHAAGWSSYGVTLAWRQTHGLKDAGVGKKPPRVVPDPRSLVEAGIGEDRAFAMAPFLKAIERGKIKLDDKTLVVIDEIATIATEQILDLARAQAKHGFKIIGIGDDHQCASISAGNTVALFRRALGPDQVPELLESIRQRRIEDRETAKMLRNGRADLALPRKDAAGLLALVPGGYDDAIKAGVDWLEKRQADNAGQEKYTVGVSVPTNADVYAFGLEYRARQRAAGKLQGGDWIVDAIDQRGSQYGLMVAVGDRVRLFHRVNARYGNTHGYFGENGTTAEVVSIDQYGLRLKRTDGKVGVVRWKSLEDKDTGRVRLSYGSALTIDARQSETLTDHLTLLPDGSQAIDGHKAYSAGTRAREDDMLIVSHGAEKEEVRNRRPMGDPWLDAASETEMRGAIIDNVARNLSRQPEKVLGVDFLERAMGRHHGGVDAQQATWSRPAEQQQARQQDHPTVADLKTAITHSPIKLLPGPEQVRREKRSMRPAAERPKTPRPTRTRDHADVVAEFADALRREGFQLRSAPIMDGRWHREKVEGDRGHTKSGRYKAYTDGLPAGFIQNFKRGEGVRWHADRPTPAMTDAERQQLAASRAARVREQAEALQAATAKAQDRWAAGTGVKQHPYLKAKGITADAEAFRRDRHGNLMTAMVDGTGLIRNVQTIARDGTKRFMPGAQVTGLFSLVGKIEQDRPIVIAEAVATAKTMHDETGLAVVIAYTAGNLGPVSKVIAEVAPNSRQIFAADNDHHLPRLESPQPNVGREKAEAAAREVGGIVLLPRFGDIETSPLKEGAKLPTDWNDFAALYGKEKLKATIEASLQREGFTMPTKTPQPTVEQQAARSTQAQRDAARQAATSTPQQQAQQQEAMRQHLQQQQRLSHNHDRGLSR